MKPLVVGDAVLLQHMGPGTTFGVLATVNEHGYCLVTLCDGRGWLTVTHDQAHQGRSRAQLFELRWPRDPRFPGWSLLGFKQ